MDFLTPAHGLDLLPAPVPAPAPAPVPIAYGWEIAYALIQILLGLGPLWLVLYLALSIFAVDYSFLWTILVAPPETNVGLDLHVSSNWSVGIVLLVLSATLKATWVGAWAYCLVTTWFCDLNWEPKFPCGKSIMQADNEILDNLADGSLAYLEGRRPRRCPKGCDFDLTDRVYHCTEHSRCLPVYDHYCKYLRVIIYLRTMKAYLFVLVFLPLDGLFTISVCSAAIASERRHLIVQYGAVLIWTAVIVLYIALYNTYHQLKYLAWYNITGCERDRKPWTIAYKFRNLAGEWRLQPQNLPSNPWDLGPGENLRQVFGHHWYQWSFFWWLPDRVSRYGRYAGRDLPFADFVLQGQTLFMMPVITGVVIDPPVPSLIQGEGRSRRRLARSSGFRRSRQRSSGSSATHAEGSVRRRPETDHQSGTEASDS